MSDPWDDDDEPSTSAGGGGEDSKLVKDLRKQLREMTKERDELNGELSGFKVKDRQSQVASLLEAHEANPKIARFMPADIELTKEAVGKWLDDEGDVFGYKRPDGETEPDAREAAYRRIDGVADGAIPPSKSGDLIERIMSAKNAGELDALIQEQSARTR